MIKEKLQLNKNMKNQEIIPEEQFQQKMTSEIEPLLNKIRKKGYFSRESKKNLYYEEYISKDATKNIVISHGFTENTEKYKELIYYFYRENYNVFIMDHQGHGNSFRALTDYSITHVEKFDDYVKDLKAFVEIKVKPNSEDKPLVLFAHSMGGAIGGCYLEKYPNDFEKAIFSSPMFEIDSGNTPLLIGKVIADFKCLTGRKRQFVFTQTKFNEKEQFEDSCSISRVRYDYFFQKRLKQKEYQNYCSSYSWLQQSIRATRKMIKPVNLARINIPVIVFQAEKDTVVKARGQNKFSEGVRNSLLVFVPESKHEIYMATNKVIAPYLDKIFDFIR